MNKKECDEKGRHKVSIEHFDQVSERKSMSGPACISVNIGLVFWCGSSHCEEVESKVDILLNCQETENTSWHTVNKLCEFGIDYHCVAVNSENLIYFLCKCFMVSVDMHSKELLNKVFRVTQSSPYDNERLEGKDKLNFGFVWHSKKATWKYPVTQICKDKH